MNPCEARKLTNQPPILPAPPMTSARRPLPAPCATTLACSCVVSDERISSRSSCSASAARDAALGGRGTHAHDHLALALVVARRLPVARLTRATSSLTRLALGHQRDQLAVDLGSVAGADPPASRCRASWDKDCRGAAEGARKTVRTAIAASASALRIAARADMTERL